MSHIASSVRLPWAYELHLNMRTFLSREERSLTSSSLREILADLKFSTILFSLDDLGVGATLQARAKARHTYGNTATSMAKWQTIHTNLTLTSNHVPEHIIHTFLNTSHKWVNVNHNLYFYYTLSNSIEHLMWTVCKRWVYPKPKSTVTTSTIDTPVLL